MQHSTTVTLFRHLCLLFCVTLCFHFLPSLSSPIDIHSLSISSHNDIPLEPRSDTNSPTNHLAELEPLHKRDPKTTGLTYHNRLGLWRMIVTAVGALIANPVTDPGPGIAMANLMGSIAREAAANFASNAGETGFAEFTQGAVSVTFILRNALGTGLTIPWDLVEELAKDFAEIAIEHPAAFMAQVTGPMGTSALGTQPWIQIVMTVAGEVISDGVPFSIY